MSWIEPVPGYPGWFATEAGQVIQMVFLRTDWVGWEVARRATPSDSGYERVRVDGRNVLLHRLVLFAHRGPPPTPRHHGAHGDGDKGNNALHNLSWKTPEENEADKKLHGTAPRGGGKKLSPQKVGAMRRARRMGESISRIARRFGLHRKTVARHVGEPA